MRPRIRVGIVDDHPLYRDGVVFALESESDIEVIGQGESAQDALHIAQEHSPDVLLLDMNMPGGGINAVSKIAQRCPTTKTLMLTVVDDEDEVRSALRKGAKGYLLKGTGSSELVNAIRSIHRGQNYVSPSFAAQLIMSRGLGESATPDTVRRFPELSDREEQILMLILQGLSNRLIGDELGLTEKTVKGYVTSIMDKLHVRNRVEAAMLASERVSGKR
ncbi:response regulator [Microvirga lotononidis]|uniref:Response regulator containing a CheY-like receiver domain and an HTH DNA-binding domain n=1 Tax=Microvirga lotononidis TaxID=864069 RepID=I4YLG1_9HYPH|nr:response regulator transcription factor [Microvirga lotononidis]EIM24803.1 response regulator containing a CheY-like receiver domain and an HTH DNA-binding domain [Microvirga lotononidis]WQO29692.1 response regulator transcription factor [Microvirga lotononidis]